MGWRNGIDLSKENVWASWWGNEVFLHQGSNGDLQLLINGETALLVDPDGKMMARGPVKIVDNTGRRMTAQEVASHGKGEA